LNESGPRCFRLLPLQQAMVLTLSANPHAGVDVQQCIARVREPLDRARLTRAWQMVMLRHEGLRTHFLMRGVECLQQVNTDANVECTWVDWRTLSLGERDLALETFLGEDRARGFDLWSCPVWRVTTFDCGEEGFRFVFSHPHAIVDSQSAFIILKDLFALYADPAATLPPAGTLEHFMRWHANRDADAAAACWREVFQGFESRSALLLPKAAEAAPGLATFEKILEPALGERIRRMAEREKLPLSAVAKAAWSIVLSRLSTSNDVVFGEVRLGRRKEVPDMQLTVGMFVATVPVRVVVQPDESIRSLIQRLRSLQGVVRDHEHTVLADIQKWCGLDPGTPLFESVLVYDPVSDGERMKEEGGAWLDREISHREHTAVPITLNITALPELAIKISWDRARFVDGVMRLLPGYVQNVLAAFAEDPDCLVSAIPMLGQEQHERLLVTWNATAKDFDRASTLTRAFEAAVQRHPERIAVTCAGVSLTYRELECAVRAVAVEMYRSGARRGSLVGLCLDRSIAMLVAMLATLKNGAAYVPLDPAFPDERLRFMVTDAKPALVVVGEKYADRLAATGAKILSLDEQASSFDDAGETADAAHVDSQSIAYVIYTSGSTGRPKGVMLTQQNVLNCFAGMDDVLDLASTPTGRWLAVTSISFDISVIELLWTLTRGFSITLSRDSADPAEIVSLLESGDITHLQCTPALAGMVVSVPGGLEQLRRLRMLVLGGEPLPQDLVASLQRPVVNVYGPTETTIWSTASPIRANDINIGRPIANTVLYVLDSNRLPVPTGVAGELYIGGLGVAKGYLNRPELTAEKFLPDPFTQSPQGARMYRTGDLVRYREDGTLEYLERLDNQVKIRGHRIELGEVEAAMRALPAVADAVVLPSRNRTVDKFLVAYFTLSAESEAVDHDHLRAELATTLPSYAIPARFKLLPSLPLTPNLKIDRKALADLEGVEDLAERRAIVAPRTDAERQIARLWQDVLGLDQVGVTDDFFSLGGDSLRAVQVALGIRNVLGVEIAANALHQHPTIEALARDLEAQAAPAHEPWATWETLGQQVTNPPIIGVHGVDRIFVELARHLGLRVEVITSRVGFDGKVAPYYPARSVEDMAERYLEAIRERYPHGPYILMGFCLGGLIATEVARHLIRAGEQVSFLGLFNTPPCPAPSESLSEKVARHRKAMGALGFAGVLRYAAAHGSGFLRHALRRLQLESAARPPQPIVAVDEAAEINRRVSDFGLQLVREHRFPAYAGCVHLFHGAHWPSDYLARWSDIAQGGARSFLLQGGHLDMMEEPHVAAVARRVREELPAGTQEIPAGIRRTS